MNQTDLSINISIQVLDGMMT